MITLPFRYHSIPTVIKLYYDPQGLLLKTEAYTYDLVGNRIKPGSTFARANTPPALASASYDANNQQTVFGASTETYDLNGNLATTTDAGVTTTYTWNARNQLAGISKTGFTASFTMTDLIEEPARPSRAPWHDRRGEAT